MRLPVAAKVALHRAGANGGTPGSPTPLAGTSIPCSTMCTRGLADARELEVVEVALLHSTALERYLAVARKRQPHHRRTLDLRADSFGVDRIAAVDRCIDPRNRDVALVVDCHLHDSSHV
jgi:hypothetical protein